MTRGGGGRIARRKGAGERWGVEWEILTVHIERLHVATAVIVGEWPQVTDDEDKEWWCGDIFQCK